MVGFAVLLSIPFGRERQGAVPASTISFGGLKSEIRNPRSEGGPKAEIRTGSSVSGLLWDQSHGGFGLRCSDFLRVSVFGFRI